MSAVKKLSLGFRPERRMFRLESIRGLVIEAILDARGAGIADDFYTSIAEPSPPGVISMINLDQGNILFIDRDNVLLTKDVYRKSTHVDLDSAFLEFKKIFIVVQSVLKLNSVRRIGLVAEHRFDATKSSTTDLITKLTKLPCRDFSANFTFQFETRTPTGNSPLDALNGAFLNTISQFYDSAMDASAPAENKINANLDYQRYFTPSIDSRKILDEAETHFYAFKKELTKFDKEILELGIKK